MRSSDEVLFWREKVKSSIRSSEKGETECVRGGVEKACVLPLTNLYTIFSVKSKC